jgi:hypothetical protein
MPMNLTFLYLHSIPASYFCRRTIVSFSDKKMYGHRFQVDGFAKHLNIQIGHIMLTAGGAEFLYVLIEVTSKHTSTDIVIIK